VIDEPTDLQTHNFVCERCKQQNLGRTLTLEFDDALRSWLRRTGTCGWCQAPYVDRVRMPKLP
jgi:hypothetical protein